MKKAKPIILYKPEQKQFEKHPHYSKLQRQDIFIVTKRLKESLKKFRGPAKAMLFVKYIYFRTHNKFYETYSPKDIARAEKVLQLKPQIYNLDKRTMNRIEKEIMSIFDFKKLSSDNEDQFIFFIHAMIRKSKPDKDIFDFLIEEFVDKRVVVPPYQQIEELIFKAYDLLDPYEQVSKIKLTGIQKGIINEILHVKSEEPTKNIVGDKYKGTKLKKIEQSKKLRDIKQGVKYYNDLKRYYSCFEYEISLLDIDTEGIKKKANEFRKMDMARIRELSQTKRTILILCFIEDHLYKYTDHFVEIILDSIQGLSRKAKQQYKEQVSRNHSDKNKTFINLIEQASDDNNVLIEVIRICKDNSIKSDDKIDEILGLLKGKMRGRQKQIDHYEEVKINLQSEENLMTSLLVEHSTSVKNKLKPILEVLEFGSNSQKGISVAKAVSDFKYQIINIKNNSFLGETELKRLESSDCPEESYAVFLLLHVASLIKSGELNLPMSYKYKSLEDYLIPLEEWTNNKDLLIKQAGLLPFRDIKNVLETASKKLSNKFDEVNDKVLVGQNKYFNKKGTSNFTISTPATDYSTDNLLFQYFPRDSFVSLSEILSTVNDRTNYLQSFQHIKRSYLKGRPAEEVFIAGLIALGCNIGEKKMAKISKSVNSNTLRSTLTWYFTKESLSAANDAIVNFTAQLSLPKLLQRDVTKLHTSSDGSRWAVSRENILSRHSLKYFGLNKGVNINSQIDERHLAFHSKIISASDREAASVLDGLLHNPNIKSDMHSTDTHGYTEALFAIMTILGFRFAPRIKSLKDQRLYSFETVSEHKSKKHSVLPHRKINTKIIEKHFDEILRIAATIGTKHTEASQIFKRINSYSNENPIYKATKELGKIFKSMFILDYLDSVTLRQAIEKQLNRVEESQKFSRAIGFGNNQELIGEDFEALEVGELSRRLIKNAIICWNYLFLTKRIIAEKDKIRRAVMLRDVSKSSILHWQHLNFLGEYDFNKKKIKDSVGLKGPSLIKSNVTKMWSESQTYLQ